MTQTQTIEYLENKISEIIEDRVLVPKNRGIRTDIKIRIDRVLSGFRQNASISMDDWNDFYLGFENPDASTDHKSAFEKFGGRVNHYMEHCIQLIHSEPDTMRTLERRTEEAAR